MSNCVSCGTYAAEGNMICPNCHTKANKAYEDLEQDYKALFLEHYKVKAENAELKARLERTVELP